MSDGLVAFLRARLAEDEADAASNRGTFPSPVVWDDGGVALHARSDGQAIITWHKDPAEGWGDIASLKAWAAPENGGWTQYRVLAEVAAKKAIMAVHRPYVPEPDQACLGCAGGLVWLHCPLLRALAAVYADHPDYRDDWRP